MLTLEQVRQFLYYEARLLDDRQWDDCVLDARLGR